MPSKAKTNHSDASETTSASTDPVSVGTRSTKLGQLTDLLKRPEGTSLDEMQLLTGWQSHSVRAAMSGLRKTGHDINRLPASEDGPARYRIGPGGEAR